MAPSPIASSGARHPRTQPLAHRLSVADAIVVVGALAFAGSLCFRGVAVQAALIDSVVTVGVLVLILVVPRGVVEMVGLLRELVRLRSDLLQRRVSDEI